jgi:hypothetical protein
VPVNVCQFFINFFALLFLPVKQFISPGVKNPLDRFVFATFKLFLQRKNDVISIALLEILPFPEPFNDLFKPDNK